MLLAGPTGGLPSSANVSGAALDTSALRFGHPLRQFPGLVFKGNGECSPHSTYDYLSVRTVLVPTLEREAPAIRVRTPLYPRPMKKHNHRCVWQTAIGM